MNSGTTILGDRETIEFLRDHPQLLAIADVVRATQADRTLPMRRRTLLPVAAAVAACIAVAAPAILSPECSTRRGQPRRGVIPVRRHAHVRGPWGSTR